MGDSESPSAGAALGGMRRNKTIASFNMTSADFEVPSAPRPRLGSFDVGWITRSVRRVSLDTGMEGSVAATVNAQSAADDNEKEQPGLLAAPPPEGAPRMGARRKSESSLWKWFNTPMTNEHDVKGRKISESDESGNITGPSLTSLARKISHQAPEANKELRAVGAGKSSVWGNITKDKMATRDINALSPSNW